MATHQKISVMLNSGMKFNSRVAKFKSRVADTVDNGNSLYLYYTGSLIHKLNKAEAFLFGIMGPSMKDGSILTRQMEKVVLSHQSDRYMRETRKTI